MWISVKERLPGSDRSVIVFGPNMDQAWMGYYYGEGREWLSMDGFPVHVTHWMELPELPKSGE